MLLIAQSSQKKAYKTNQLEFHWFIDTQVIFYE